jgi:hypothetical protein
MLRITGHFFKEVKVIQNNYMVLANAERIYLFNHELQILIVWIFIIRLAMKY